jgi:peroxiredoxin
MCHLQDFYAKYKSKGLVVLGFDAADNKKIALQMLADNNVTFPNIIDSSDAANKVCHQEYQRQGQSAVPMSYIIDREGKIAAGWYGYHPGEPKAVAALKTIDRELGEAIARDEAARQQKDDKPKDSGGESTKKK